MNDRERLHELADALPDSHIQAILAFARYVDQEMDEVIDPETEAEILERLKDPGPYLSHEEVWGQVASRKEP